MVNGMCLSVRTLNGLGLLVCSMDGTVAFLDFSQDELGDALNEEEKVNANRSVTKKLRCWLEVKDLN